MTDTTERAELLALADRLDAVHQACYLLERDAKRIASALRRLAAQDQKPVAWHSPTDSATPFVKPYVKEAMLPHVAAQYSVPLYLSPPPAAGWKEAIEACTKVADTWRTSANPYRADTANAICQGIEALRHNAPPDSGAGKSAPPGRSSLPPNQGESDLSVTTGSSGADAGVDWKKKFKGKTSGGAWIHTHPSVERAIVENHHGFTFDGVAYNSLDEAKTAALSHKPDAAETNASAEARLREALEAMEPYLDAIVCYASSINEHHGNEVAKLVRDALSAHSPASDCDKHGCMGDMAPGDPKDLAELLAKPSVLEPSDRTADVTVDELRAFILKHGDEWEDEGVAARALLDAFTVGKRLSDKQGER